jgi:hypothetical protein
MGIGRTLTKPRQKLVGNWDIGFQITNWTFGFWFDTLVNRKGLRGGIALGPLTIDLWT